MTKCCNWQDSDGNCPKHPKETPALVKTEGFENEHAAMASGVAHHTANILNDCFPNAREVSEKVAEGLGPKIIGIRIEFRSEDRDEVIAAFCDEVLKRPYIGFVKLERQADDTNSEFRTVGAITARCDWLLRGVSYNPLLMLTLVVVGQVE